VIDDVVLSVEEACTNAIRHSGSPDDVEISLYPADDDLVAVVKDRGHGFDVTSFDPAIPPDLMSDHGRGLFIIASVMDSLELRLDAGLEVRMTRRVAPSSGQRPFDRGLGEPLADASGDHRDARTRAMLEEIDEGFVALDWEYRYDYVNEAMVRLTRRSRDALLGHVLWELFPELQGSPLQERFREAMELGTPSVSEHRSVVTGDWLEVRIYPTSVGVSAYYREINARKRAEAERERLLETTSLLLEAATAATSSATLDQTLAALGDLLVRSTEHSRVVLELWDEELQEVEVAVARGTGTVPLQRFEFDDVSEAARQAITTRKTAVVDYAQIGLPGPLKRYLDEHAFLLLLAVPIVYRDRPIGVIMVDQPGERRQFSPDEITLVEAIAAQAGAVLESARLLEREAVAARFETSVAWSRTTRLIHRLHAHPWFVLAGAIVLESVSLVALSAEHAERRIFGLPGSVLALVAVIAGAAAGSLVGALVALAGGVAFFVTVGGQGTRSTVATTAISTAVWLAAGLLSGLLAEALREQTERRRLASVALARADAAREVQLAEQARIEELASGLQAQSDALAERADLAEALNAINAVAHSTLDFDDIMGRALARGVAALHTDAGTIVLRDGDSWVVTYQQGFSAAEAGLRLSAEQAPVASRIAATGQPLAVDDLATEPRLDLGFPHAHDLRALVAVPLIVRQEVIGGLVFWERRPRSFSQTEVDFARQLGATVSLAVDNAHLYLEQQRIATTLQENFIHPLPAVAGLDLGMVAQPASAPELVGGDFSDVFVLDDSHVVALIGDVAGKGVRAAGHTETVRSTVRALAAVDRSPAFILGKTNELLLRFDPDEPLVTAFLAVLDTTTGHLIYASAGHLPPVHLSARPGRLLDVVFGTPLGSFECRYADSRAALTPGDYLVLYTDGLTEARRDGEIFGEKRLLETVGDLRGRSAQDVAEALREAALAFAGSLGDDLHVVVLRRE
jgi:PAS domain S-box-containing protein